jgi:hypothetical protein
MAFSTQRSPLPLATMIGRLEPGGPGALAPMSNVLRLAAEVVPMKRRRLIDFLIGVSDIPNLGSQVTPQNCQSQSLEQTGQREQFPRACFDPRDIAQ